MQTQVEWWTPTELAKRWRVDASTVRRWCCKNELAAMKTPGGDYRIHVDVIEAHEAKAVQAEKVNVIKQVRRRLRKVKDRIGELT